MYLDTPLEDNGYNVFRVRSAKEKLSDMEQAGWKGRLNLRSSLRTSENLSQRCSHA